MDLDYDYLERDCGTSGRFIRVSEYCSEIEMDVHIYTIFEDGHEQLSSKATEEVKAESHRRLDLYVGACKRRKRLRQVRDALNKCASEKKIERIASILDI